MPRAIDAGTLTVGTGLAAEDSIEANALVHPTGGNDGLRVHILDPSRAHEARAIHVEDTPGNFVSDHVEGALEELAGAGSASGTNGLIQGGTWTAAGPVITLETPTLVRINGSIHDFSGDSIALPDGINYVYIDVSSSTLTSSFTAPVLTAEDILLSRTVVAAGVITSSVDGRFFVFNLDRKPPLTIRSEGADFNQRSEAAFVTLEAALLYLEEYAGSGTPDPMSTHRILVRGQHIITETMLVPVDGVIFEGDGDGIFRTGATVTPMFDLNGKDRVKFWDLQFICDHAASAAITDGTLNVQRLAVERCEFISDGFSWDVGIHLAISTVNNTEHVIRDCTLSVADIGVAIERASNCTVENVVISATANIGTVGIGLSPTFGPFGGTGGGQVIGCSVRGLVTGIWVEGADSHISNCNCTFNQVGIRTDGDRVTVDNCTVILDGTDVAAALWEGIRVLGDESKVSTCHVENPRTTWTASAAIPRGIFFSGVADGHITGTKIEGFTSTNGGGFFGFGVEGSGASGTHLHDLVITGCANGVDIGSAIEFKCSNVRVEDAQVGILASSDDSQITGCTVVLDATNGLTGIHIETASRCRVSDCNIENLRGAGAYAGGELPRGIWLEASGNSEMLVSNCRIANFRTTAFPGNNGHLIHVDGMSKTEISGIIGTTAQFGIYAEAATDVKISDCQFTELGTGILGDTVTEFHTNGTLIGLSSSFGLTGISLLDCGDSLFTGLSINNPRGDATYGVGDTPVGITIDSSPRTVISDCRITGFYSSVFGGAGDAGHLINVVACESMVVSNIIGDTADVGIEANSSCADFRISNCDISGVRHGINLLGLRPLVAQTRILLDVDRAEFGVSSGGTSESATFSDCHIECPRTVWAGETPVGIGLNGANNKADNNTVKGFDTTADGYGIQMFAGRGTSTDNTILDCYRGIANLGSGEAYLTITSNRFDGIARSAIVINEGGGASADNIGLAIVGNNIESCGIDAGIFVRDYQGVNITGNTLNVANTAGYGIYVIGVDILDRRVRNLVIGDNIVKGATVGGIRVEGEVNDATITGNVINNTWGDGIQVTGHGIHLASAATAPRDITVTGNTVYNCISGIFLDGFVSAPLLNIKVNGNNIHHCAVDNAPGDTWDGQGSKGVACRNAQEVTVNDNQVDAIGLMQNDDGTSYFPAGPDNSAQGMIFYGTDRLLVSGNNVVNYRLQGAGIARGIAYRMRDATGAVTARQVSITGNSIDNQGGPTANVGILVDVSDNLANGAQALIGLTIDGNTIRRNENSIYVNLDLSASMTGVTISDNTCDIPSLAGVNIDVLGDSVVLDSCTVTGNTVVTPGTLGGIGVNCASTVTGSMRNVVVNNNSILDSDSYGIFVSVLNITGVSDLQNLEINGNSIHSPAYDAINLNIGGGATGSSASAVTINNNAIYDVQGTGPGPILGIGIGINVLVLYVGGGAGQADLFGCTIAGNTIDTAQETGISVAADSDDADVQGLAITGNTVRAATTNGIRLTVATSGSFEGTSVTGNTIHTPTTNGILCNAVAGANYENINILGNTVNTPGAVGVLCYASGSGAAFTGLTISENRVSNSGGNGIGIQNVANGAFSMVQVNHNTVDTAGGNGIAFSVVTGAMEAFQVNGNNIYTPGVVAGGSSQGIGIVSLGGSGPTSDWQICDNIIQEPGTIGIALGGIAVFTQATGWAKIATVVATDKLIIGGVDLTGVAGAPAVDEFDVTGDDLTVAQNMVDAINDAANSFTAIVTASRNGNVVNLTAVPVGAAGNAVTLAENTGATTIVVSGAALTGGQGTASDASDINRFQINRNNIHQAGEVGILMLTFDGSIQSITCSDNLINRPGFNSAGSGVSSTAGAGILFGAVQDSASVSLNRLTLDGNRLTWDTGDTPGSNSCYGIGFLGIDVDITEVYISNCHVESSPGASVYLNTVGSTAGRLARINISDCDLSTQATADNAADSPHNGIGLYAYCSAPLSLPHGDITVRGCRARSDSSNPFSAAIALFSFPFGGADAGKLQDITIIDNHLVNSFNGFLWTTTIGTGGTFQPADSSPVMQNIAVKNNEFRDIGFVGVGLIDNPASRGSDEDLRLENITVSNNEFHTVATDASTGFSAILLSYTRCWDNLRIDDNTFMDIGDLGSVATTAAFGCIDLRLGVGTGSNEGNQNISVSRNVLNNTRARGIQIQSGPGASPAPSWRNVRVDGNDLRNVFSGGVFVDLDSSSGSIDNLSISNNSVNRTGWGSGIGTSGIGEGIYLRVDTADITSVAVSHNQVQIIESAGTYDGITLVMQQTIRNLSVIGNNVRDSTRHGFSLFAGAGVAINENILLQGNTFRTDPGSAGDGIHMVLDGTFWRNVAILGNQGQEGDNAWYIEFQDGCTFEGWTVHGNFARGGATNQVSAIKTGVPVFTASSFQMQGNLSMGPGTDWTTTDGATTDFKSVVGGIESSNTDIPIP